MQPFVTLSEKVGKGHTAVIVIDMQNDFCSEQGAIARSGHSVAAVKAIAPALQRFLADARSKGVRLIFIKGARLEGDVSMPMKELWLRTRQKGPLCARGTWGAELIPEIQPAPGEPVIEKTRYSAFYKTNLEDVLHSMDVQTVIVTGVATNVCVETTSRDAFMRNFYVVLPRDLVAGNYPDLHEATLVNIERYFGTVTTAAEIVEAWDQPI